MIREMIATDVTAVVAIHMASFPGFFLTSLGQRFLKTYYGSVLELEERIAFVKYSEAGNLQGFVVGSANPRGFYTRLLKKRWYRFALASVAPALKNPMIIFRLLRALSYPSETPTGEKMCGLYSICVDPLIQSHGIGRQLVECFLHEAQRRNCREVFLTTDKLNNQIVNNFYQSLGFEVAKVYVTPEGRQMYFYIKQL